MRSLVRVARSARPHLLQQRNFSSSLTTRSSDAALAAVLEAVKVHRPDLLESGGGGDGSVAPMRVGVMVDGTWLLHRMMALYSARTGASISDYTVQAMHRSFRPKVQQGRRCHRALLIPFAAVVQDMLLVADAMAEVPAVITASLPALLPMVQRPFEITKVVLVGGYNDSEREKFFSRLASQPLWEVLPLDRAVRCRLSRRPPFSFASPSLIHAAVCQAKLSAMDTGSKASLDMTLAAEIVHWANTPQLDLIVPVLGSAQYLPVLKKARANGKPVVLASFSRNCARDLGQDTTARDADVLWLDQELQTRDLKRGAIDPNKARGEPSPHPSSRRRDDLGFLCGKVRPLPWQVSQPSKGPPSESYAEQLTEGGRESVEAIQGFLTMTGGQASHAPMGNAHSYTISLVCPRCAFGTPDSCLPLGGLPPGHWALPGVSGESALSEASSSPRGPLPLSQGHVSCGVRALERGARAHAADPNREHTKIRTIMTPPGWRT